MIIIEWAPITKAVFNPPFGNELKEHLDSYKDNVKSASCSAWKLLYKVLVESQLSITNVSFTETGKPYFVDKTIYFNISHSKNVCAVAVSDFSVGVDIEVCRDDYNPHLIERSLAPAEKVSFDGDFTRLWCRKEALAKMTGEGITGYPSYIDTTEYKYYEQLIEHNNQKFWIIAVSEE